MTTRNIDFVVTWVNGNDRIWQEEKNKYISEEVAGNSHVVRYRYWGLLPYWFRGVEKFAPWVHKVHFVTSGHLPDWLNTGHEKLNIVPHSAFIPKQYLPTFNSNSIELFMHKIPSLSEQFVYFNDDVFLINRVKPDDFFKNGQPCDLAALSVVTPGDGAVSNISFNNIKIVNRYFQKKDLTIRQWRKVLCPWYEKRMLIRSLFLYPFAKHTGFIDPHLTLSFTKSTFETIWSQIPDELSESCSHRFRTPQDFSIWLMRYWNLAKGNFVPHGMPGKYFFIGDPDLNPFIRKQKGKVVCCNDRDDVAFEQEKRNLMAAFESILPEKSQFEK